MYLVRKLCFFAIFRQKKQFNLQEWQKILAEFVSTHVDNFVEMVDFSPKTVFELSTKYMFEKSALDEKLQTIFCYITKMQCYVTFQKGFALIFLV